MRVVSMVPSWTETLIAAGVNVVGRTHFCIHPSPQIKTIPAVGGTKNISVEKVKSLKPDLLLLDKEENPRHMSELGFPFFASHVCGVQDVAPALKTMGEMMGSSKLLEFAHRWESLKPFTADRFWQNLPVREWLQPMQSPLKDLKIFYVIWRDPWMVISRQTFIGSMLQFLGAGESVPLFEEKYPKLQWEEINEPGHVILFSSEPYDFIGKRSHIPELKELRCPAAFVEGEPLSWYGIRSLEFIEGLS